MICWCQSDLPCGSEQRKFRDVLETDYYANVYEYEIPLAPLDLPSAQLELDLLAKVECFTSCYGQDSNNLLIVQYNGHGSRVRNLLTWSR